MKEVIRLDWSQTKEIEPRELLVEFTHSFYPNEGGWVKTFVKPGDWDNVSYLGECGEEGHMFACKDNHEDSLIQIYKGCLNSGRY